jgi:lysyl endopeptidase
VTDSTSLFDYAPGTNTKTFTRAEWPRFNSQSCKIDGQPTAEPATPAIAARACRAIKNEAQKADCMFDVTVTGETGFARTYRTMQAFKPLGTGWKPVFAGGRDQYRPKPGRR